jgi:hypothetical protein
MRAVAVMPKASVSTADTLLQIYAADANRPLHVTEISLSAFGTSSTDTPLHVQLVRQSDAGTGGTDVSVRKMDNQLSDSVQGAAIRRPDSEGWGAEPTSTEVLREWAVHPQGGLLIPIPDPESFVVAGGERLALKLAVAPDASTPIAAYMEWEE